MRSEQGIMPQRGGRPLHLIQFRPTDRSSPGLSLWPFPLLILQEPSMVRRRPREQTAPAESKPARADASIEAGDYKVNVFTAAGPDVL